MLDWEAITADVESSIQKSVARTVLKDVDIAIGGLSIKDHIQTTIADFISSDISIRTKDGESEYEAIVRTISQTALKNSDNRRRTEDRRVGYRAREKATSSVPNPDIKDHRDAKAVLNLFEGKKIEKAIIISVLSGMAEFKDNKELAMLCDYSVREITNAKKRVKRKLKAAFALKNCELVMKDSA